MTLAVLAGAGVAACLGAAALHGLGLLTLSVPAIAAVVLAVAVLLATVLWQVIAVLAARQELGQVLPAPEISTLSFPPPALSQRPRLSRVK